MTSLDLVVVREPGRLAQVAAANASEDGTTDLAAALAGLTGRHVPLFEGFARDAPPRGLLLVRPTADFELITAEMDPAAAAALPTRTVIIGGNRHELAGTLERFTIAAGVDEHRYFLWRSGRDRDRDPGQGLFGLKAVAATMPDATLVPGPRLESERYGYIVGDRTHGLPGELVAYLRAYVRRGASAAR